MKPIFFISLIFPLHLALAKDDCLPASCSSSGPTVKFPFWLKGHQPEHCGYPGFALSCRKNNDTEFEFQFPVTASIRNIVLPLSVNATIWNIDYTAQLMYIHGVRTRSCLPKELPSVSSSASMFSIYQVYGTDGGSTLFSCSPSRDNSGQIPCLNGTGYQVLSFPSTYDVSNLRRNLYCFKMYNVSYIPDGMFSGLEEEEEDYYTSRLSLHWSVPSCGGCEAEGGNCRLKNNGTEVGTECFSTRRHGASKKPLVAGIVLGAILALFLFIALYQFLILMKGKIEYNKKMGQFLEDYKALRPSRFSYADIKNMTGNFKEKLGQGIYGTVYEGKLTNEIPVSVKVLPSDSKDKTEGFVKEVETIGRIHHVNVVRLIGYCADGHRRALVYEFIQNGSLEKLISSGDQGQILGWEKVHQIALGIATGIGYLHQGCSQRIVHSSIKPENILLDDKFNPKVSDFGVAKLCSKELTSVSLTAMKGAIIYTAPEVFSRSYGAVFCKADIYSFGMLLLDMIGGRQSSESTAGESSEVYFPEWMYNQLEKAETIDIHIERDDKSKIVKKLAIVALWCIQWYPGDRPSMKVVNKMLEGDEIPILPPNPFACMRTVKNDANAHENLP